MLDISSALELTFVSLRLKFKLNITVDTSPGLGKTWDPHFRFDYAICEPAEIQEFSKSYRFKDRVLLAPKICEGALCI